jgi:hypothetical protein
MNFKDNGFLTFGVFACSVVPVDQTTLQRTVNLTLCSLVPVSHSVMVNICSSSHIPVNLQHSDDFVLPAFLKS